VRSHRGYAGVFCTDGFQPINNIIATQSLRRTIDNCRFISIFTHYRCQKQEIDRGRNSTNFSHISIDFFK